MRLDKNMSPRHTSSDDILLHEILKKKKPPKDPIKAKLWHYIRRNKKEFPDEASLRELLDTSKPPADPIKAKAWYYLWQEATESPLTVRDIFGETVPVDPVKAELWKYRRAMILSIFVVPFWAYLAYASSAAAPGYQTLDRVGFRKWIIRFFIINSHVNIWGILAVLFMMAAVLAVYVHQKRRRRIGETNS